MTPALRWIIAILAGLIVGLFVPTDDGMIEAIAAVAAGGLAYVLAGLVKPKVRDGS